jgi:hypothetical protein
VPSSVWHDAQVGAPPTDSLKSSAPDSALLAGKSDSAGALEQAASIMPRAQRMYLTCIKKS